MEADDYADVAQVFGSIGVHLQVVVDPTPIAAPIRQRPLTKLIIKLFFYLHFNLNNEKMYQFHITRRLSFKT